MNAIAMSLPFLFIPVLYAGLVKVAALILRRIELSWKHALIFGLLATVIGAIGTFANVATERGLPTILAGLIGVAIQLALGSWYFKDRARLVSGSPVGLVRGALLPLIAIAFSFVLAIMVMGLFPPGLPHDGRP